MQLPKRRQTAVMHQNEIVYLTPEGIRVLEAEIRRLDECDRPRAVRDVSDAVQKGDLSENAEYQEARARLSRIEHRLIVLREKRKRVEPIAVGAGGKRSAIVAIGSTVVVSPVEGGNGQRGRKTYEIVGPEETDPMKGRISFRSSVGAALLGKKKGDVVFLGKDAVAHEIVSVR